MSDFVLPTEAIAPTIQNPKKLLLYGPPKVGKTGVLAELADNFIIDLENGTDYVTALKTKVDSFAELSKVGQALKTKKVETGEYPYKFVTIDTVTELEAWCESLATTMYKNTIIGKNFKGKTVLELPKGAGYYWLRIAYKEWLDKLSTLAPTIILVGHVKDKFIEKKGNDVAAKDLDLTGKIRSITAAGADAIGYMYRDPDNSKICKVSFKSTEELICGSRCAHLKGQIINISESDDQGKIISSSWEKIFID